jgi:GTP-binding protein
MEPIEEVTVDVDEPYAGIVIEKISSRKGELRDMRSTAPEKRGLSFTHLRAG